MPDIWPPYPTPLPSMIMKIWLAMGFKVKYRHGRYESRMMILIGLAYHGCYRKGPRLGLCVNFKDEGYLPTT